MGLRVLPGIVGRFGRADNGRVCGQLPARSASDGWSEPVARAPGWPGGWGRLTRRRRRLVPDADPFAPPFAVVEEEPAAPRGVAGAQHLADDTAGGGHVR